MLTNFLLRSGVSNVAQFSIPEFLAEGTAMPHYHAAAENNLQSPHLEDPLGASRSREYTPQVPDRTHITPLPRHADSVSEVGEGLNRGHREDSKAVESDEPGKQKKRNRRKNRKKLKRRRKEGRRNGRRGSERQREGSDTSVMKSLLHDIKAEIEKWNQS